MPSGPRSQVTAFTAQAILCDNYHVGVHDDSTAALWQAE